MKNDTLGLRPHLYHAIVNVKSGAKTFRYSVDYFFPDSDKNNDAEVYQAIQVPTEDLGYTFEYKAGKDFKDGDNFDAEAFAKEIKKRLNDKVDKIHEHEDSLGQLHNLLENPIPTKGHKHSDNDASIYDAPGEVNSSDVEDGEPGTDKLFYANKGDDNEASAPKNDASEKASKK